MKDLKPLLGLDHLRLLSVQRGQFSKQALEQLRHAIPQIRIQEMDSR